MSKIKNLLLKIYPEISPAEMQSVAQVVGYNVEIKHSPITVWIFPFKIKLRVSGACRYKTRVIQININNDPRVFWHELGHAAIGRRNLWKIIAILQVFLLPVIVPLNEILAHLIGWRCACRWKNIRPA